jgi:hypothetical protein
MISKCPTFEFARPGRGQPHGTVSTYSSIWQSTNCGRTGTVARALAQRLRATMPIRAE